MSENTDGTVAVIGCVGILPALLLSYILRGWALVTLWMWFITPVFHIPAPNYAVALGLGLFLGLASGVETSSNNNDGKSMATIVGTVYAKLLLQYPMIVFIGWVVKHWA